VAGFASALRSTDGDITVGLAIFGGRQTVSGPKDATEMLSVDQTPSGTDGP
jgi:hypothetical protein